MAYSPGQLFNFIQGSDITGESSYDIWKRLGNEGSEADFLEYIRSGPKGDPGESAVSYRLAVSDTVIKKDATNTLLPGNITFNSFYRIGTEATRYDYAGKLVIQETIDGDLWTTTYTSSENEASKVYTPSSINVTIIKCTLYSADDETLALDTQSVVILSDVSNLKIGARNLLANSDRRYEVTKDSTEVITDAIFIVDGFDLQRLIGKTVALSYYVNSNGEYEEIISDGMFGMSAIMMWSDSTGTNEATTVYPFAMSSIGVSKDRVSNIYEIIAPEGYDTIDSFAFEINLSIKPTTDEVWVFERPKLEIGTIDTEWIIAQEDIINNTTQPDWSQSDETAKDYIKNKPTDEDAFLLAVELGLIEPVVGEDSSIYTDENGLIYLL